MGFWIKLADPEDLETSLDVANHTHGGVIAMGGSQSADMSVTYNYSEFWPKAFGPAPEGEHKDLYGLGPWLHNREAGDTMTLLMQAFYKLEGEPTQNYWEVSEANARENVLRPLINWGLSHPLGVWVIYDG